MNPSSPDPHHPMDEHYSVKKVTNMSAVEIGERLFQWRDFTPIPLIIVLLFVAEPSARSATIGTLVVLLGEAIRIYSVAFIGSISRTRSSSTGDQLITEGPFGLVRNPLYVGNFFIVLGLLIYGAVTWVALLGLAAFAFQYFTIVKYEETILLGKFGDEYQRYLDTVPAWFPTKLPNMDEFPTPPNLIPAFKSEKRTFVAIGMMLVALMLRS